MRRTFQKFLTPIPALVLFAALAILIATRFTPLRLLLYCQSESLLITAQTDDLRLIFNRDPSPMPLRVRYPYASAWTRDDVGPREWMLLRPGDIDPTFSSYNLYEGCANFTPDPAIPALRAAGFYFQAGDAAANPLIVDLAQHGILIVPYWFPAALAAVILGAQCFIRVRRRIRGLGERGHCIFCGYDLRVPTARCPECGNPATAAPARRSFKRRIYILDLHIRHHALLIAIAAILTVILAHQIFSPPPHYDPPPPITQTNLHPNEVRP